MYLSQSEQFFLDVNVEELRSNKQPFDSQFQYQNCGGWYRDNCSTCWSCPHAFLRSRSHSWPFPAERHTHLHRLLREVHTGGREQPSCPASRGQIRMPHAQTRTKCYSTMRMNKPQSHGATRTNPPNIIHTMHNATDRKKNAKRRDQRLDSDCPGWGDWERAQGAPGCWVLVTYVCSNMQFPQSAHLRGVHFTVRLLYSDY